MFLRKNQPYPCIYADKNQKIIFFHAIKTHEPFETTKEKGILTLFTELKVRISENNKKTLNFTPSEIPNFTQTSQTPKTKSIKKASQIS